MNISMVVVSSVLRLHMHNSMTWSMILLKIYADDDYIPICESLLMHARTHTLKVKYDGFVIIVGRYSETDFLTLCRHTS